MGLPRLGVDCVRAEEYRGVQAGAREVRLAVAHHEARAHHVEGRHGGLRVRGEDLPQVLAPVGALRRDVLRPEEAAHGEGHVALRAAVLRLVHAEQLHHVEGAVARVRPALPGAPALHGVRGDVVGDLLPKVVAERQMKSPTLYSWPSFTSRDRESARVPFFGAAGPGSAKSPTRKSGRSAKHAREGSQVFRMKYGSCLSLP